MSEDAHRARLELLYAVQRVQDDPGRFLALVTTAAHDDAAVAAVEAAYGVSRTAAHAMVDVPFRRLTALGRQRVADEVAALETSLG